MTTIYNNKYDIDGEAVGDQSGYSVSMNSIGDIVAIGAIYAKNNGSVQTGHVRVYKQTDGKWEQLGIDIDGEGASNYSGWSVSMNSAGDIVAIGAIFNYGGAIESGHVRVYQYIVDPEDSNAKIWSKLGDDIDGEAAGDRSGSSVSMNSAGDIVAIGAIFNGVDGIKSGHVRVWKYIENPNGTGPKLWKQLGPDINGEAANDESGSSVSMNSEGTIVAIGAELNDDNGDRSGHVRVYQYNDENNTWKQLEPDINGEAELDFGGVVSMNSAGDIVAIGASLNDSGDKNGSGHVRVWKYDGSSWQRLGQDLDGDAGNDQSGWSVSMNSAGDIVTIGARQNDGNGNNSGHVRVWKLIDNNWERLGQDIDSESVDDQSGQSVSMNSEGTIVAIGANNNDVNGLDSGHTRVFYYRNNAWNQAPPGFFKVSDNGVFTISGTVLFTVQ
jgi:hypothetical protein